MKRTISTVTFPSDFSPYFVLISLISFFFSGISSANMLLEGLERHIEIRIEKRTATINRARRTFGLVANRRACEYRVSPATGAVWAKVKILVCAFAALVAREHVWC